MKFRRRLILIALQLMISPALHAADLEWRRVEHTIVRGETLRLIALKYFGLKDAYACIVAQVKPENPHLIRTGEVIAFSAPARKISLSEFRKLKLTCQRDGTLKSEDNVTIFSPDGVAPAPPIVMPSPPVEPVFEKPEPASTSPAAATPAEPMKAFKASTPHMRWQSLSVGTGAAFTNYNQTFQQSTFRGSADFRSVKVPNQFAELRFGVDRSWHTEIQWQSIPGEFATDSGGPTDFSIRYDWRQINITGAYQPERWTSSLFGIKFRPGIRLGASRARWALARVVSETEVEPAGSDVYEGHAGIAWDVEITDRWIWSSALQYAQPVHLPEINRLKSHYILEGYTRLYYRFSDHWGTGLNWHGRAHEAEYTTDWGRGQTQFLYSAMEVFLTAYF